jgi:hypothetical protein
LVGRIVQDLPNFCVPVGSICPVSLFKLICFGYNSSLITLHRLSFVINSLVIVNAQHHQKSPFKTPCYFVVALKREKRTQGEGFRYSQDACQSFVLAASEIENEAINLDRRGVPRCCVAIQSDWLKLTAVIQRFWECPIFRANEAAKSIVWPGLGQKRLISVGLLFSTRDGSVL